jgi:hypothetical protein
MVSPVLDLLSPVLAAMALMPSVCQRSAGDRPSCRRRLWRSRLVTSERQPVSCNLLASAC